MNLVLSNIRRSKWQVLAITVLLILASALTNILLFLQTDYRQNYFREKERLNGEDINILLMNHLPDTDLSAQIEDTLDHIEEIRQYEIDRTITAPGSVEYNDGSLSNDTTFLRFDAATKKQIGRYDILESADNGGIYVSYIFKVDGGYRTGQTISVKLGAEEYAFTIAGFYHNTGTGTPNCLDIAFLLPDDTFDKIASTHGFSYRIGLLLNETEKADLLESSITKRLVDGKPMLTVYGVDTTQKLSNSRYITATLFEAIITISAYLMVAVILATIAITLSNYIRNNIKNLGALKALGYRSADLILPMVGEFSVIAVVMSLIGIASSYVLLPILNAFLEKQVGIPYTIRFLFWQTALTVLICVITAALSAFLSVLKIKRISPINAIREVQANKGIRHNFFALDKTRLGLNTALSLKATIAGRVHGVVLFVSMTVIAFLLGFSAFTYQNVILDQNAILDLICGQRTDSVLSVRTEYEDQLLSALDANDAVERYFLYSTFLIAPSDMSSIYANVINTDYQANAGLCVAGCLPKTEKEIAVNPALAGKYGLALGDTVSIESGKDTVTFTIVGLAQGAYHSGRDCYLTYDGYLRISVPPYVSYYVDLKEGVDIDRFNTEMAKSCSLVSGINYEAFVTSVSSSYIQILILATVVVVIMSYLIAAFILYVLISVLLANKRREHGILKSLGFVTKDLSFQTVFCNIPPCLLGTVLGLFMSKNGAAALLTMALESIGIFSFGTPTKAIYLLASGIAVMAFVVLFSLLMTRSIRKITPHRLFSRE